MCRRVSLFVCPYVPVIWDGMSGIVSLIKKCGNQAVVGLQDFDSQIGEFCCKWAAFCTVHLKVVPTVKITLETPFPCVPAGNDPCGMSVPYGRTKSHSIEI